MLSYHAHIRAEAAASDSLHVLARGLGMHEALADLVLASVSKDHLILGLNISRSIATCLIFPALMVRSSAHTADFVLPRVLSADYSVQDRAEVYAGPGFVILTSSVLVHDLLHQTLPVERVAGIVVFAADAVRERSTYHFALSLFRRRNRTAFIKAFSEAPVALSTGFHSVEKLMRILYVSRLCVWPRFHAIVRQSLSSHVPDLVDLSVSVTPRSAALCAALHTVVDAIMHDLKLATHALDEFEVYRQIPATDDAPVCRRLVSNFDDVVRRQMDCASTRTARVRALVADLSVLRNLLRAVFESNPVAFYQHIVTIRASVSRGSNWLVRRDAQQAISLARNRVWQTLKDSDTSRIVLALETPTKWTALHDVLQEIQGDVDTAGPDADVGRVLVFMRAQSTMEELDEMLRRSAYDVLKKQFERMFPSVAAKVRENEGPTQMTMTQLALPPQDRRRPSLDRDKERLNRPQRKPGKRPRPQVDGELTKEELDEVFQEVKSEKSTKIEVMLRNMEWVDLQGCGHRILDEYRPSFVVLYNSDLALVRQVEVYKALQPGRPVRMYVLAYDDAPEEDRFRQASAREKTAFKSLIRERAAMTILVNQEGREADDEFTQSLLDNVDMTLSSRRRGRGVDRDSRISQVIPGKPNSEGGKVLVDTRELRSSLPMLLYRSKLTIVPLTLEVGDFVLSTNIGIERKSVSDLYGSFGSGRLFNQAECLCRHYKYSCLLIELESGRSLSLTATSGGVPSELAATSIVGKMVLLLQQFPTLRILWAKGPQDAAEMFVFLKVYEDEPNIEKAASFGVDSNENEEEDFNAGPKTLLRSLPGIDSQNLHRVMRKVRNLATLLTTPKQEMVDLLGNAGKATRLFKFVNDQATDAEAAM